MDLTRLMGGHPITSNRLPFEEKIFFFDRRSKEYLNHQGSKLLHHNVCCSSSYTTKALEYYTEAPTETTQLRMLPKPTTSRLQLITSPKLSNSTLERPSTTEISQVSFSDTQHGNPEVSNKLRFRQWNGQRVKVLNENLFQSLSGVLKDAHEHVALFRNIDGGNIGRVLRSPKYLSQWTTEKAGDVTFFCDIKLGRCCMEHDHHAVGSGRLAGENNTGKETWMKNCSALLPSAFFIVLSVRNRAHNYYTTKAPEYYTEADAAPSYNIKRATPKLPSTKTSKSPEYYTYVAPACCTEAPKYYLPPTYYTTKAAEYYTEPPKYYTNKAPEYYTTTCASLSLYTEAPKYYSALSYTTTTEADKYYAAPTYYTAAAPSYYASVYYTTTYATPSYYTEAPMYYTTKAPEYYNTTYAAPPNYTEASKYYSIPSYYTTPYASPTYYRDAPKYYNYVQICRSYDLNSVIN
ncbi:hypothetical protein DAPPUDRAFT_251731 [Daphnia pulex]|uniref:Uncharacterized protein n=1 Tax=Daphnia pulex TaxID=6669 RepID=E9H104_DAPPU|nr:hypothetical protein DAPPUDRAFT_251731 [Daphnia pulex]|eukprot:EFX74547.1 hypothetical protein DAPPUDRAFT_251731 [Daphnia pulex]